MATIHLREVPDETLTTLKIRAARSGQSLQAYLLQLLVGEAALLTPEEAAEQAPRARRCREPAPSRTRLTYLGQEFLVGSDTLAERVRNHTAGNGFTAAHARAAGRRTRDSGPEVRWSPRSSLHGD
ncbi:hypothetical protein ABZ154_18535 [Streptomyces sp. NPDC006261]|uniref:FitA-like ribbon-helix-helix domain-containing protein n=1 Tax=Streptomyces sp. NPDC006261 TaxID=3156739 RepID=UPI0033A158F1